MGVKSRGGGAAGRENVLGRAFDADSGEWRFHLVCLALITILGGWLRFHCADVQSFKIWDDSFTLDIALGSFADIVKTFQYQFSDGYAEYQTPLFYFIVAVFLKLGHSDFAARLPGLLAGTALIPMLYLLCRELANARVGLYAALLCAVSLYQVESSQLIRVYAFFLFISVACAYAFLRAVNDDRLWRWAVFTGLSVLAFYTSYLNVVNVLFQGAFVVLTVAVTYLRRDGAGAKRIFVRYAAAMLLTLAAYAPWIKIQLLTQRLLAGTGASSGQPFFKALFAVVNEFGFNYNEFLSFPVYGQYVLALAAAGAAVCLLLGRLRPLAFFLLWMGTLLVMLRLGGGGLHIRNRHVMLALPGLYFFIACAVDFAAAGVFKLLRLRIVNREAVYLLAGLCLVLFMQYPNLRTYEYFYRRQDDRLKELAWELATTQENLTHKYFMGMETKWTPSAAALFFDRCLPGVFEDLGNMESPAYRRCLVMAPGRDRDATEQAHSWVSGGTFPGVAWFRAGFVCRSPLELSAGPDGTFAYADDFSGLAVFSDAFALRRIRVDAAGLRPVQRSAPGEVEYRFAVPEDASLEDAFLRLDAAVTGGLYDLPDARILVFAGENSESLSLAAEIPASPKAREDNLRFVARLREHIPLAGFLPRRGAFSVRIVLDPGERRGLVELRNLAFEFALSGLTPDPDGAVLRQAAAIGKNASVERYRPGVRSMAPDALCCFSMDDARTGYGVGAEFDSQAMRKEFLKEYPDAEPVEALFFPDGEPAFEFYDPALANPALELAPERELILENGESTLISEKGLQLLGVLDRPVMDLNGTRLDIPISSAAPLSVFLNPSGRGLIQAALLYTPDGLGLQAASASRNMRQNSGEECATCRDKTPCYVEYEIVSELPLTEFAVTSYPRVFSDAARRGFAAMSYSLDDGAFERAYRYATPGTGAWEGLTVPRRFRLRPGKSFRRLKVRFDLSGDDAQLWSSQAYPMRIFVGLDASGLAAPDVPAGLSELRLEGNGGTGLRVFFSPEAFDFFQGVRLHVRDFSSRTP